MDLSILKSDGYQPSAFYFKVLFSATMGQTDTSFKEVSGIGSEMAIEEVEEGGLNSYLHKLPKTIKHPNLILKRGIAKINSPLVLWCKSVLELDYSVPITPLPVMVQLMNETKLPIRSWTFTNAFPVKWEVDSFESQKNEVAIESIELAYNRVIRIT